MIGKSRGKLYKFLMNRKHASGAYPAGTRSPGSVRYASLYRCNDSAVDVCRRLVGHLYGVAAENHNDAIRHPESMHLHDLRVALRRMRSVISFFHPLYPRGAASSLDAALRRICRELGKTRDLQARLELLARIESKATAGIEPFRKMCRKELDAGMKAAARALKGRDWIGLERKVNAFEKTLSDIHASTPAPGISRFAAKRIKKAFTRRKTVSFSRLEKMDPEKLHAFRKKTRRLRYNVEIAAPALGRRMNELEGVMKAAADHLGHIHDIDMLMAVGCRKAPAPGLALTAVLVSSRGMELKKLAKVLAVAEATIKSRGLKAELKVRCR